MKKIEQVLSELRKFSDKAIEWSHPVKENDIDSFERKYQLNLPADYKYLLIQTNGFELMGNEVYGLNVEDKEDLGKVYHFEHYEVGFSIYSHLVPFSSDGGGNFYCFNTLKLTEKKESCQIVFWTSGYEYTITDEPEITHQSFSDWVQEILIDWTLEDYDYNGNEK